MEHHLSSLLFLSLSLLSFILFVSEFLKIGKRFKGSKLPPGPWKLPIIGIIHYLLGSLPHHRLRELAQKYGPLMHLQLGEVSAIVVSSPEIAKEVLKTNGSIFADRPHLIGADIICYGSTDVVLAPFRGYWKQLMKQLLKTAEGLGVTGMFPSQKWLHTLSGMQPKLSVLEIEFVRAFCLVGIANIEQLLPQLLYYFNWELPDGVTHENLDMTEAFGTTTRRKTDLLLVPLSYNLYHHDCKGYSQIVNALDVGFFICAHTFDQNNTWNFGYSL